MSDNDYFNSYENLEVHELMLKDRPRQEAYLKAINENSSLFKDKVVLDVGAGTGILSILCAKAGAKLVYAIEASDFAKLAVEVVEENELSGVVKVIQSRVEHLNLPPEVGKVDIIVSEWMGFYLLHEGMLDSVIYARDNFLKKDGHMFPQYATIYIAPCSVPNRFDYWENVDGVRMTKFGSRLRQLKSSSSADIISVAEKDLLHEGVVLTWIDLSQVKSDELNEITAKEVVAIQKPGKYQGFCIWWECQFPSNGNQDPVILSTSPKYPKTHWKQCVILLPDNACDEMETGEPIAFKISLQRSVSDQRKYNLEVEILNPEAEEHPLPCYCHMTKCILTKAHLENIERDNPVAEMT